MITPWKVIYYNAAVQQDIFALPKTLLARYLRLTDLMLKMGPNLGEPHTKYLGEGLLEIRLKGQEGISRVFYCTIENHKIHILHSFIKKQQKIPSKEIKTARQRMKEIKK